MVFFFYFYYYTVVDYFKIIAIIITIIIIIVIIIIIISFVIINKAIFASFIINIKCCLYYCIGFADFRYIIFNCLCHSYFKQLSTNFRQN